MASKPIVLTFLTSLLVFNFTTIFGQTKIQDIHLKKGEVLDILLITQNPDMEEDFKDYFKTAGQIAQQMSYQPLPGFRIVQHTQGNLCPGALILSKWSSLENREDFLSQITEKVPDFDERRRKIWRYFGLRYFEIQEDLSLSINRDRYHVATAYWLGSKKASKAFNSWSNKLLEMNGEILIQLEGGKSPFGYQYNPDVFVISSWESEADFKAFIQQTQSLDLDQIRHVNEFILN